MVIVLNKNKKLLNSIINEIKELKISTIKNIFNDKKRIYQNRKLRKEV